jgi:hypothetical protein
MPNKRNNNNNRRKRRGGAAFTAVARTEKGANVQAETVQAHEDFGGNDINDSVSVETVTNSNGSNSNGRVAVPEKKRGLFDQMGDGLAKLKFWGGRRRRRTRRKGNKTHKKRRRRRGGTGKKGYSHPKKGRKSRTRKGNKDFTTKRGNKVFHRKRHYVRKSRKPYRKRR